MVVQNYRAKVKNFFHKIAKFVTNYFDMKLRKYLSVQLLLLAALPAFGWGQKGHDTVAFIAERHLTDSTKNAISSLLGGKSIVYYANWLDNASHTPEYAYSKTWHYKNIDAGMKYDEAPLNDQGDIVRALKSRIAVLKNPDSTEAEKALALKMVVHLMGDLHQPMHMGHASDLGGNRWNVKFFKSPANLHSVWDSRIPEAAHKWSYTEWADQIDRATPEEEAEILSGCINCWAKETHRICSQVYEQTPQDTNIEYDYIARWTPTVETQFLRGGLRLADILNSLFDSSYTARTKATATDHLK